MSFKTFFPLVAVLLLAAFLLTPVHAVIVAGANGGGDNTNNTTAAELESLATVSDGHYFNNVFSFSNGNAVYIGYAQTGTGPVAYALSGIHLNVQFALTIQSITYDIQERISIENSDLALLRLTQSSDIMPSLQAITLSATTPTGNTPVVMIGAGQNRVQDATTDANTSDAVTVSDGTGYTTTTPLMNRWGTNSTQNFSAPLAPGPTRTFSIGGRITTVGQTVFDEPGSGEWLSTNEAQAVRHDSGGGVFSHDGILIGIMAAVTGSNTDEAAFGNATYFADIATYKSSIDAETGGLLIPEPSAGLLVLLGLSVFLRRRR